MKEKSDIDELYLRIMGDCPKKSGKAYEIISSALLSLLTGLNGEHDIYKKGKSNTTYQLDGLLNEKIMIEAKDYTIRNHKVGRADLQKMQGGLTDLPDIEKGIFTTATKFTSKAEKYALASSSNNMQKEIIPATIRKSIPSDLENRIQAFVINMVVVEPDYNNGKYEIDFADGERNRLKTDLLSEGKDGFKLSLTHFFKEDGQYHSSMSELSRTQQPKFDLDSDIKEVKGRFDIDAYIKIENRLYRIKGIKYTLPIVRECETFTVTADGSPEMLVSCDKLGINKIITDTELKNAIDSILKSKK